jgi:predicted GTPase
MKLKELQELTLPDVHPARLESGVTVGLEILDEVKKIFEAPSKTVPEIADYIKSCDKLRAQTVDERHVVGVIGNTGAGKSSVINAVLDEECLVPTNW